MRTSNAVFIGLAVIVLVVVIAWAINPGPQEPVYGTTANIEDNNQGLLDDDTSVEVDVQERRGTIPYPDVDVEMEETTVPYPDVDVDVIEDNEAPEGNEGVNEDSMFEDNTADDDTIFDENEDDEFDTNANDNNPTLEDEERTGTY